MWSVLIGIVVLFLAWKLFALTFTGLIWLAIIVAAIVFLTRWMRRSNAR